MDPGSKRGWAALAPWEHPAKKPARSHVPGSRYIPTTLLITTALDNSRSAHIAQLVRGNAATVSHLAFTRSHSPQHHVIFLGCPLASLSSLYADVDVMVRATWTLEVVCCARIGDIYDGAVKLRALNPPYSPYLLPRTWYQVPGTRRIFQSVLPSPRSTAARTRLPPPPHVNRRDSAIASARAGMDDGLHSNAYARVCGEEALDKSFRRLAGGVSLLPPDLSRAVFGSQVPGSRFPV